MRCLCYRFSRMMKNAINEAICSLQGYFCFVCFVLTRDTTARNKARKIQAMQEKVHHLQIHQTRKTLGKQITALIQWEKDREGLFSPN